MFEFEAKDYRNRQELEAAIMRKFSLTTEKKDAVIKGTLAELKVLSLSPRRTVWGIICESADEEEKEAAKKPDRGKKTPFGINGNLKNPL